MNDSDDPSRGKRASEELGIAVWQTMAARRSGFDAMMWQTPALGMTAQAFLLTLALGPGTARWARLISAVLSLVLSLMVMQLMAKHRQNEVCESRRLEQLEAKLRFKENFGFLPHAIHKAANADKRFWNASSYRLWMAGLALFAIVAAVIIVLAGCNIASKIMGAP